MDEILFSEVELRRRSEPLEGAIVEAGCCFAAEALAAGGDAVEPLGGVIVEDGCLIGTMAAAVEAGGDAVAGDTGTVPPTGGVTGTMTTLPSASTIVCPCTAARTACVRPLCIPQMALRYELDRRSRTVGTEKRLPAGEAGMLGLEGPRDEGPREMSEGRRSACGVSSGDGLPPTLPLLLNSVLLICSGDCGGGSVIGEWLLLLFELDRLDDETGLGDV